MRSPWSHCANRTGATGMVAGCHLNQAGFSSVTLGYQGGHLLFGKTPEHEWRHISVCECVILVAGTDEVSGWWVIFILLLFPFLLLSLTPFLTYSPSTPSLPPSFLLPSLSCFPDSREESVLGSIPLPSYVISPVGPDDHISRKYAFKVCLSLLCLLKQNVFTNSEMTTNSDWSFANTFV